MIRLAQAGPGICLLLLTSCAGNALRVEGAEAVGESAAAFVDKAEAALEDAKERRKLASATLVASDISCEPLPQVQVYVPTGRRKGPKVDLPLCADGSTPKLPYNIKGVLYGLDDLGYSSETLDLRPYSEEAVKPTILLIGAVGDYGAALAKIAARPDADVGKELGSIISKATAAVALVNGLAKANLPDPAKLLNEDQRTAAVNLLQFAESLANEQRKVREINALVTERGDEIEAMIPQLQEQMAMWGRMSQRSANITKIGLAEAYRAGRAGWDFDQRLSFVERVTDSRADADAAPARAAAISEALSEFAEAQADLRRLLAGDFNKEEKRRMARISQERMINALGLMAKTISAFGGL